jgi:hypothetical protein
MKLRDEQIEEKNPIQAHLPQELVHISGSSTFQTSTQIDGCNTLLKGSDI